MWIVWSSVDTAAVCPVAPAPVYPAPLGHDGPMTDLDNPRGIATEILDEDGLAHGVALHVALAIHRFADE